MKECPICKKLHNKKNDRVCNGCRSSYSRWKIKNDLVKCLGGSCKQCGLDDIRCLDFHHIDPKQKKFTITDEMRNLSYQDLLTEALKCIILCANCHRMEHYKDRIELIKFLSEDLISTPQEKQYRVVISKRKVNRPTKEILAKEVFEYPSSILAKKYGVSDKSIEKWCKWYNISKPSRGYWTRKRSENKYLSE